MHLTAVRRSQICVGQFSLRCELQAFLAGELCCRVGALALFGEGRRHTASWAHHGTHFDEMLELGSASLASAAVRPKHGLSLSTIMGFAICSQTTPQVAQLAQARYGFYVAKTVLQRPEVDAEASPTY